MATFKLTVVTPSRVIFDDEVEEIIVRTMSGDVGILKNHINYVAPLDIGAMKVIANGQKRLAAVAGGMIKVDNQKTTILTNACEWVDEIDVERAKRAVERAKAYIENPTELHTIDVAEIKLRRAMNRIELSGRK